MTESTTNTDIDPDIKFYGFFWKLNWHKSIVTFASMCIMERYLHSDICILTSDDRGGFSKDFRVGNV